MVPPDGFAVGHLLASKVSRRSQLQSFFKTAMFLALDSSRAYASHIDREKSSAIVLPFRDATRNCTGSERSIQRCTQGWRVKRICRRTTAAATVVKLSKRASDPLRNHLVEPLLMGLNKHFRQLATLLHSPGTHAVHCKHKTINRTAQNHYHVSQGLSSAERRTVQPNGWFDQAHQGGA